ncbi:DNA-binding response regulator [Bacillus cereus]|nr:DNA-binding response regulator [Bacillus cereus]
MRQVLVIKNERSLAKKIVSGLTEAGHFILQLHNENEGLNIIYEQDWDIIILDWDSLSISGPEICRQIRLVKMTPIIIVTDNISSEDCHRPNVRPRLLIYSFGKRFLLNHRSQVR